MGTCRHCGADRQEEHVFCPMCGRKHEFTISDFWIAEKTSREAFLEKCKTGSGLLPDVASMLGYACWHYADYKFGDLRRFGGMDVNEEIPRDALEALSLVKTKAEELFSLLLDY